MTKYQYDPFGQLIGQDGKTNTNYLYTNQEYDQESELYYYNARYYNPRLGRFISRDPFLGRDGDSVSRNGYSYVKNNPLKYVDPSGEFEECSVYDQPEKYLGKTIGQWNDTIESAQENLNFVGDLLTFGMFSNAFDRAEQASQRMIDEGVNFSTVGNTIYQVGMGTVGAGGGALMTGMTAGELKLMATPFFATKAIEQESKIIAPQGYKFTQNKYSPNFSNYPESTFQFKGQPVENVVSGLKSGKINPTQLPIDYIERNGTKNILNTRSTVANSLAGTEPVFVD
ncbi:MAG TPA: RHS repeat-associated core domain-containing protein, partial [Sediminibacterium sp.]|uniref:RHS repeat-associated core domain-containing protein n=1 Tax=Sediminibacterium sp. TaxID=1917865 RepID=UPI002B4B39E1